MAITAVSSQNSQKMEKITNISRNTSATNIPAKHEFQHSTYSKNASLMTKVGVFLTTLVGVAIPMALILKKSELSLNPFKTAFKDWGVVKVEYKEGGKEHEL